MSASASASASAPPDWASSAAGRRGAYASALVALASALAEGPVPVERVLSPAVLLAGGLPSGSVASLDHVEFVSLPDGTWRPSAGAVPGVGAVSGDYLALRGAVLTGLDTSLLAGWLPASAVVPLLAGLLCSTRLWCSPSGSVYSFAALSSAPPSARLCELPGVFAFSRGGVVPSGWVQGAVPLAGSRSVVLDTVAPWSRRLLVS